MMNTIRFSVVIPVYNTESYLNQCVSSVLEQTYGDFEIILVDDGSTDKSDEICDMYAKSDKRVTVIHKENCGAISARISGLNAAKGEYVLFLDSDDMIRFDTLESMDNTLSSLQCDMLIFEGTKDINYTTNYSDVSLIPNKLYSGVELRDIYNLIVNTGKLNSMCFKIAKRTILLHCYKDFDKYFWVRNGEDAIMSLHLIDKIKSAAYTPEIYYYYRTNTNSITMTYNEVFYDSSKVMCQKKQDFSLKWLGEISNQCYNNSLMIAIDALKREMLSDYKTMRFHYNKIKQILADTFFISIYGNSDIRFFSFFDRFFLRLLVNFRFSSIIIMLLCRIRKKFFDVFAKLKFKN